MRRAPLTPLAALLLALALAFLARPCSPGARMSVAARAYLEHLSGGRFEEAHGMLTDSLGARIIPVALAGLAGSPTEGALELEHWEPRGFVAYLRLRGGGNRTLWLRQEGGTWLVSGDTSLDNLLGSAGPVCRRFAEDSVIPLIEAGMDAGGLSCPITGLVYSVTVDSLLVCPAGHLGPGLDLAGSRCAVDRENLALLVRDYVEQGFTAPSSFREMYDSSGGAFGQPGGYRCPDHGYSYYEIRDGSVYCPWHGEGSPIQLPEER